MDGRRSLKYLLGYLRDSPERVTQLYIIHLAYLSTARGALYCPDRRDICPKCLQMPGSFFHLIWQCSQIQGFWAQVVRFLHDVMGSSIPMIPQCCLHGLLDIPDLNLIPGQEINSQKLDERPCSISVGVHT